MAFKRKEKRKKSSVKKSTKADKKHRKSKKKDLFSSYIYKLLKQIHADLGISKSAMSVMNSFVNDTLERLASEASRLMVSNGKRTLTSADFQTAVRLLLPNELGQLAINGAIKALSVYNNNSR